MKVYVTFQMFLQSLLSVRMIQMCVCVYDNNYNNGNSSSNNNNNKIKYAPEALFRIGSIGLDARNCIQFHMTYTRHVSRYPVLIINIDINVGVL